MDRKKCIESFNNSRNAGDSRRAAWEAVEEELNALIAEFSEEGLSTARLNALAEWWANLDYRSI
jgi:hypothetical protein